MLDSNDLQVIKQIVNEVVEKERDQTELEVKLKEAQQEANFLSAQVCAKEKQLQQIKRILKDSTDFKEGRMCLSLLQYDHLLDILERGIV